MVSWNSNETQNKTLILDPLDHQCKGRMMMGKKRVIESFYESIQHDKATECHLSLHGVENAFWKNER